MLEKIAPIFITEAAKKAGSNIGNTLFNCTPHKYESNKVPKNVVTSEALKFLTTKHDWEAIGENSIEISQYVELLGPVAAKTVVAYLVIPVVVGATSFALFGAGASTIAYGISNVGVLAGGTYAGGKRISSTIKVRKRKKTDDDQQQTDMLSNQTQTPLN